MKEEQAADIWILAIDDELSIQKLLVRYLELAGYNCISAGSGLEARRELKERPFDLVLCDLKMPDESGLELIRYVKDTYPDTARVMVTASSDPELAKDIMDVGVYGYIIKPLSRDMLLITVENALRHHFLDLKMRAYKGQLEEQAWSRKEKLGVIMDNLSIGVAMISKNNELLEMNHQMRGWFPGIEVGEDLGCYHRRLSGKNAVLCRNCPVEDALLRGDSANATRQLITREGERDFHIITSPVRNQAGEIVAAIELLEDVTEQLASEREMNKRQKLEAMGQLASGIVHEINTPVQYVMDNIIFMEDSFGDILRLVGKYEECIDELVAHLPGANVVRDKLLKAQDDADIEYLKDELPKTLEQSIEGMKRINGIVRSMKEFSHPGSDEKNSVDINVLLENAITISKNEWKYVADVETNLDHELPYIPCLSGEMNQVFLNLIVNAAHAISTDSDQGGDGRGTITVTSEKKAGGIRVVIADTGGGIPEEIRDKIFKPFFTTKGRGEGTGQGLAIAQRVVVDKHQGTLSYESNIGKGTRFIIELPDEDVH
jgi:signal transduction histidine kinase/DNA-binding NarL/FixJ family response regulator